ncbi:MAG TPA: tripartite tricarboxylate transporter substrate binding protein [Ramlibacter sp.]|nr:tripartite tricarboxylate transporter substrate binding protein [Ramlibacter sp.]
MSYPFTRRHVLAALGGGLAAAALPSFAAGYPARPVKLMVGSPPGGPVDFMARLFGDSVGTALGGSFVVENRPGASGTLAAEAVARSQADGHTLLLSGPAVLTTRHLMPKLSFDAPNDLQPVAMTGAGAFALVVHPSVPARNVAELIALARSKPGTLSYGSGGNGSSGQLCMEVFSGQAGTRLLHVPYKGDGQAVNDLLAGQIQVMFTAPNVAMPHVRAGKLRLLAVTTRERVPSIDAPTVHESGLADFEYLGWVVVFAPSATPKASIDSLVSAWQKARGTPAVKGRLEELAMVAPDRLVAGDALARFLKAEDARLGKVIRDAGIRIE